MKDSRKIILWTGLGYLLIFITGFFSNFFVLESNFFAGDAQATIESIAANEQLFRIGVAAFVIMVITDVILALPLYFLFKHVNPLLSLLSAVLRVVNGAIFAVALFYLVNILMGISDFRNASGAGVLEQFSSFDLMWKVGLIFFGIHLVIMALLMIKKNGFPKFIGWSMLFAGIGYLIDSFGMITLLNYNELSDIFELIVLVPAVIGELSFTIFLLVKGLKTGGTEILSMDMLP